MRGNPEFTKQWRSSFDNFALLCRLTLLRAGKKSTTVNHFTINHALQTPWSLFVPLESSTLGYSCIFKKFLLWNFGKIFSLRQRFYCYIHRLEQWIFKNYSLKSRWIKNRSLQNFQPWQFTSLSLRKQQRNGLMKPLKVWIVSLPEKKSRALLFSVDSPSL